MVNAAPPPIPGLSANEQSALIALMDALLRIPNLHHEIARRACWLKWALQGYDPFRRHDRELVAAAGWGRLYQ